MIQVLRPVSGSGPRMVYDFHLAYEAEGNLRLVLAHIFRDEPERRSVLVYSIHGELADPPPETKQQPPVPEDVLAEALDQVRGSIRLMARDEYLSRRNIGMLTPL